MKQFNPSFGEQMRLRKDNKELSEKALLFIHNFYNKEKDKRTCYGLKISDNKTFASFESYSNKKVNLCYQCNKYSFYESYFVVVKEHTNDNNSDTIYYRY